MLSPLKKSSLLFLFLIWLLIIPLRLSAMEGRVSDTEQHTNVSGSADGVEQRSNAAATEKGGVLASDNNSNNLGYPPVDAHDNNSSFQKARDRTQKPNNNNIYNTPIGAGGGTSTRRGEMGNHDLKGVDHSSSSSARLPPEYPRESADSGSQVKASVASQESYNREQRLFQQTPIKQVFLPKKSAPVRSAPRFSDFSASPVRYSAPLREFQDSHITSVATAPLEVSKKVITSDDFPEHSWLGKKLANFYTARCNFFRTYFKPPELEYESVPETNMARVIPKYAGERMSVDLSAPLEKKNGITGLLNVTGACQMNASLQVLKVALNSMRQNMASTTEREELEKRIQEKTPQLWGFLNDTTLTNADCLKLQQEMAQKLSEDHWYSYHTDSGIAQQSVETGYINSLSGGMTKIILHQLEAPQIYFEQSSRTLFSQAKSTTHHSAQSLSIIAIDSLEPRVLLQDAITRAMKEQGRVLDDPVPCTLVCEVERWQSDMYKSDMYLKSLDPILLKHKDGSYITYQPKAIKYSFHSLTTTDQSVGHALVTLKTTDGNWYTVSDNVIELDIDHEKLESNPKYKILADKYIDDRVKDTIIYEKIETGDAVSSVENEGR